MKSKNERKMGNEVKVGIYRNLDNRKENLPDTSPRALQLHKRRAAALHEIFDSAPKGIKVKAWGNTDAPESHEFIELCLVLSQPAVVHAVGGAALAAAKLLGAAVINESVKVGVKWVFDKLRKKQEADDIEGVSIKVTPKIDIQMDSPKHGGRVFVKVQIQGEPWGAPPKTPKRRGRKSVR